MGGLFSSPKPQPQPAPTPPPAVADKSAQEAAEAARVAASLAGGRASTIATSGQGDASRPTLLTQSLKTTLGA